MDLGFMLDGIQASQYSTSSIHLERIRIRCDIKTEITLREKDTFNFTIETIKVTNKKRKKMK